MGNRSRPGVALAAAFRYPARPMPVDLREVHRIASCELRRLLRDGHTLVYSIAIPLFLYPTLFLGAAQVLVIARGAAERRVARVAVQGAGQVPELDLRLDQAEKVERVPLPPEGGQDLAERAGRWIRERSLDAVVGVSRGPGGRVMAEVFYNEARDASSAARELVESALEEFRAEELRRRAAEIGENEAFLETLEVRTADITPREERARRELARVVPLLLLLMLGLGALYPALDTTVGERERGTLETTLLAPVGRTALVLGKFLPVTALALLAAALNLASMGAAIQFFLLRVEAGLRPGFLFPVALAAALPALALLALLVAAVMLSVALCARSFKEGQSYLGPVLLLAMAPGFAATVPEVRLTALTAATPVLNLALLVRDLLQERLDPTLAAEALAAGAAYTALGIMWAGRLLGREATFLGSPALSFRRLREASPGDHRGRP